MSSTVRLNAIVSWFDIKKGFGYLRVISSGEFLDKNIFVHYKGLLTAKANSKYLRVGEYVSFDLAPSNYENYEFHAINVSGIDTENSDKRNPLMCDSIEFAKEYSQKRREEMAQQIRVPPQQNHQHQQNHQTKPNQNLTKKTSHNVSNKYKNLKK